MNEQDIKSEEITQKYSELKTTYDKLGVNLTQALELFAKESDIDFLTVYHRVKDDTSLINKIKDKKYKNPFEDVEDFCGIRIICYYQSDVEKLGKIIEDEFDVLEKETKAELLGVDQFGYRSDHYIVKIKENWIQAPNYRGLQNYKCEIQVRTILMHAWAEISHKLSYKKKSDVPTHLTRKLSHLSSKLEESDEQFEELRNEKRKYKSDIIKITKNKTGGISRKIELNLDSLQAFLDGTFPERKKELEATRELLDDLNNYNIKMEDLINYYDIVKKDLKDIEKDYFTAANYPELKWHQVGPVRTFLKILHHDYKVHHQPTYSASIDAVYKKWTQKYNKIK